MWVQMNVSTILFDSRNSSYIVVLKDETGKKILPIWIGAAEGNSIAMAMSNVKPERPFTHDLIVSIFDRLEIEIARVSFGEEAIEDPALHRKRVTAALGKPGEITLVAVAAEAPAVPPTACTSDSQAR